jgi:N-glycosidase YbiA
MAEVIRFYSVRDELGAFSNFAAYPIMIGKKRWPTTEHYFQAQKFTKASDAEEVRQAKTPEIAARLGRSRKKKIRPDWDRARISVMRTALRAKFDQHTDLRDLLLSTGEAKIVEHTDNDDFWGDGGDGSGQNMLGRLLRRSAPSFEARLTFDHSLVSPTCARARVDALVIRTNPSGRRPREPRSAACLASGDLLGDEVSPLVERHDRRPFQPSPIP